MPECEDCADDLVDPRDKNAAGWWRDRCLPCISEDSCARDERRTVDEILNDREADNGDGA